VDETGSRPADGVQILFVNGDEARPWEAYCRNMKRDEPSDYITVSERDNFSQFSNGVVVAETRFRRLRIDPHRLEIDPLDTEFATTSNPDPVLALPGGQDHLPAGVAQYTSQTRDKGRVATARIDLSGSGFVMGEAVVSTGSTFFCSRTDAQIMGTGARPTSNGNTDTSAAESSTEISSDLSRVMLSAVNKDAVGKTTSLADCDNMQTISLAGNELPQFAAWPLQYSRQ
jgi:hypothetical protein